MVAGDLSNGPWQYNITVQVSDQFGNIYTQVVQVIVTPPPPSTAAAFTTGKLTTAEITAAFTSGKQTTTETTREIVAETTAPFETGKFICICEMFYIN